jgi:predicted nuclease of restriction endonuclease-like (RecB) superfamily
MPEKKKLPVKKGAISGKLLLRKLPPAASKGNLFERVVRILEKSRVGVVRAVNSHMVLAYWLVGREIVQEIQSGKGRAEYGKQVVEELSIKLTQRYKRGFSVTNIGYFRQFYLVYADRVPVINHEVSRQTGEQAIPHEPSGELPVHESRSSEGVLKDLTLAIEHSESLRGFSPNLSWTHYRTLLRVDNLNERCFYEIESARQNWSVPHLERQMHTCLFARLIKSKDKQGVMALATKGQEVLRPVDTIKHPYVLDFLDLPDGRVCHEIDLEAAIMDKLQPFLLELGKGFAFIDRQHRIETEHQHFYIDLVFYNYLLKCFVLIDLKVKKLAHQDIGQMDMYVRMFDDLRRGEGDNPTVGIILCAEKDEVVVKYSVLKGNQQLFASKYMLYLPSEDELRLEIERECKLIEAQAEPSSAGG